MLGNVSEEYLISTYKDKICYMDDEKHHAITKLSNKHYQKWVKLLDNSWFLYQEIESEKILF